MRQISRILIAAMLFAVGYVLAQETKQPAPVTVCLADVTVTAQPTNKRHQSYVFTLKSKMNESSWTFELSQDGGGRLLLYAAGNRSEVTEKTELKSHHQKQTRLRLQESEPYEANTGDTITHRFLSLTWGEQEPNKTNGE